MVVHIPIEGREDGTTATKQTLVNLLAVGYMKGGSNKGNLGHSRKIPFGVRYNRPAVVPLIISYLSRLGLE